MFSVQITTAKDFTTDHFSFVSEKHSGKQITWLSWRHRFQKALFSTVFCQHENEKPRSGATPRKLEKFPHLWPYKGVPPIPRPGKPTFCYFLKFLRNWCHRDGGTGGRHLKFKWKIRKIMILQLSPDSLQLIDPGLHKIRHSSLVCCRGLTLLHFFDPCNLAPD